MADNGGKKKKDAPKKDNPNDVPLGAGRGSRTTNAYSQPETGHGKAGVAPFQKFKNTSASFRTKGKDSPVQRYRKAIAPNKPLDSKGFTDKSFKNPKQKNVKVKKESFEDLCAMNLLGLSEVVRRRGSAWVLYDDDTGVEVGSYKDRKTAWDRQRLRRAQSKKQRQIKRQQSKISKQHTSGVGGTGHKVHKVGKAKNTGKISKVQAIKPIKPIKPKGLKTSFGKHESFENAVVLGLLMERVAPYVFKREENKPSGWDNFVSEISKEAMHADPMFKGLVDGIAKAHSKQLRGASLALIDTLQQTGKFKVSSVAQEDADPGTYMNHFNVSIPSLEISVPLSVKVENGRSRLVIPQETKDTLNGMSEQESRLLRAELMHVQETSLASQDDVARAANRRDNYLKTMEGKLDKLVSGMQPMQVQMLSNLMKAKYGASTDA